jgi:hypothetical protein
MMAPFPAPKHCRGKGKPRYANGRSYSDFQHSTHRKPRQGSQNPVHKRRRMMYDCRQAVLVRNLLDGPQIIDRPTFFQLVEEPSNEVFSA